jgi:uncharacterized membrane protein YsdA (DUF1294 family)
MSFKNKMQSSQFRRYQGVAIAIGIIVFVLGVLLTSLSYYLVWLAAFSLSTFILYGLDKTDAKFKGSKNRVPELLLHFLALLGGFVGGWAGMVLFWHKVRKPIFWLVLGVSTLLHVFGVSRFF